MIDFIRDCPISPFLRRFVGLDFKIHFLPSEYPPGMPQVESRILILKSDFTDLKAAYRAISNRKVKRVGRGNEVWLLVWGMDKR